MSGNSTAHLRGLCPAPFYDNSRFPTDNGFVAGRFCASVDPQQKIWCCLPCPATDFLYPNSFNRWNRIGEWVNVAGFVLCGFLLLSYLFLPAERTKRHYLSYCLIIGIVTLTLGFIIPLAAEPEQCLDEITPNDMFTSLACAFSGAFVIAGGLIVTIWVFIRALSMHLQICWDQQPGKKFFYFAQIFGWGVAAALFTATITVTGVSFRFGHSCHVNSRHAMKGFWGPLLGIAGLTVIIQIATFVYCIHVYLKNLWSDDKAETEGSSTLPSYTSSLRTQTARAVYRRVKKVVWLQWRGLTIVFFILTDVIFFSVVFVYLDTTEQAVIRDVDAMKPWALCLMTHLDDRPACYALGQQVFVNEATVVAVLMMLSLSGVQCFILLFRWSMVTGWAKLIRRKLSRKREFVSLDATRVAAAASKEPTKDPARTIELVKYDHQKSPSVTSPPPLSRFNSATLSRSPPNSPPEHYSPLNLASPSSPPTYLTAGGGGFVSPVEKPGSPDYFSKETGSLSHSHSQSYSHGRAYRSPSLSFSAPRSPSRSATMHSIEWDPRSTHARGGLGYHPPQAEGGSPPREGGWV